MVPGSVTVDQRATGVVPMTCSDRNAASSASLTPRAPSTSSVCCPRSGAGRANQGREREV